MLRLDEAQSGASISLEQIVDRLPARERAVTLLRLYGQASYPQIAETLGVSEKTVAIRLAKARRRLRQLSVALKDSVT